MVYQCPYCSEPYIDPGLCQEHMLKCSKKPESKKEKPLEKLTVEELKALAAEKQIEGFENMIKADLVKALKGVVNNDAG